MKEFICLSCGETGYWKPNGSEKNFCNKQECRREFKAQKQRAWRENNPNRGRDYYEKNRKTLNDGKCDICGEFGKLVRDHDHGCCPQQLSGLSGGTCGMCWRGSICHGCNKALGFAKDNPIILLRMVDYLMNVNPEIQEIIIDFDSV